MATLGGLQWVTRTEAHAVNYTLAFAISISLPLAALAVAAAVSGRLGSGGAVANFTRFGYALIPLDLAAHLAHNLFHLLAEGKSVLLTGLALFGHEHGEASAAIASTSTVQVLQFALIGLGVAGSLYTAHRIGRGQVRVAAVTPVWLLLLAFGALNVALFTLPMTMRV